MHSRHTYGTNSSPNVDKQRSRGRLMGQIRPPTQASRALSLTQASGALVVDLVDKIFFQRFANILLFFNRLFIPVLSSLRIRKVII